MRVSNRLHARYIYQRRDRIVPYLLRTLQLPMHGLGIPVTRNDRRLEALRDRHQGQRAFVIGMGPSLRISDLDRLKGEVTFGCNKVYLAFDESDWRPTYYSIADLLVAENSRDTISKLNLRKIFGRGVRRYFRGTPGIVYVRARLNPVRQGQPQPAFSENLLVGAYGGATVVYMQLQLAFHMGIREIYLVGMDFKYTTSEPTGELTKHGEVILMHEGEMNYFHPDYRKPGEKWSFPQIDEMHKAFSCAKEAFERAGGFIANASRQTALDVFPIVDFDELVPS